MTNLKFKVQGQIIQKMDDNDVVEKSRNEYNAVFEFSDDWIDIENKQAYFTRYKDGFCVKADIDENGICKVPWEVTELPMFYVSVAGGDLKTVTRASVFVEQTGYSEDAEKSGTVPEVIRTPQSISLQDGMLLLLDKNGEAVGEGVTLPNTNADKNYSPESTNAQSGVAVAEAMEQTQNIYANALKGREIGEIISAYDVSPIEHNINLKVESKNLIPFKNKSYKNGQYVAGQNYEINGVSFTVNDDGSVYAVGTATESYSIFYLYTADKLEKGNDVVTLSGSPEGSSATTYFLRFRNDIDATGIYEDYGSGVTINDANVSKSSIAIIVLQDQSIDATFFPKLEYGNTASEYTVPVDPSTVTVTMRGGNIADVPNQKFKSYSGNMNNFIQWYIDLPIGTEITVSADCNTADSVNGTVGWFIKLNDGTSTIQIWRGRITNGKTVRISYTHTKTVDFSAADINYSLLYLGYESEKDKTFENITVNIGNKDLGYEKFKDGYDFTPNADGTVNGIRSTTPNMTFAADTKGVNLTCEYNKDINKVIEDLVNAIISLGGNV